MMTAENAKANCSVKHFISLIYSKPIHSLMTQESCLGSLWWLRYRLKRHEARVAARAGERKRAGGFCSIKLRSMHTKNQWVMQQISYVASIYECMWRISERRIAKEREKIPSYVIRLFSSALNLSETKYYDQTGFTVAEHFIYLVKSPLLLDLFPCYCVTKCAHATHHLAVRNPTDQVSSPPSL